MIAIVIILILMLFAFLYAIEYGNMTEEEKRKRLEKFEKYNE